MATVEPIVVIFLGIAFLNEVFAPIRAVGAAVVLAAFVWDAANRPAMLPRKPIPPERLAR